jgi:hypothetical protein
VKTLADLALAILGAIESCVSDEPETFARADALYTTILTCRPVDDEAQRWLHATAARLGVDQ